MNDRMSHSRHREAEKCKVVYFVGKGGGATESLEKFEGTEKETSNKQ